MAPAAGTPVLPIKHAVPLFGALPRPASLAILMAVLCALLYTAIVAADAGAEPGSWLRLPYYAVFVVAAGLVVARAASAPAERRAWSVIGAALGLWAAGRWKARTPNACSKRRSAWR